MFSDYLNHILYTNSQTLLYKLFGYLSIYFAFIIMLDVTQLVINPSICYHLNNNTDSVVVVTWYGEVHAQTEGSRIM